MQHSDIRFSIADHAAWAPGLATAAHWLAWARDERAMGGDERPALDDVAPMLRRRASAAGRMAMQVAGACLGERRHIPIVYASRHGECARSVDLLQDLAAGVALSPGNFSLSVHNASAGLFSIAKNDGGNHIAIAAGPSSTEQGLIEACGLLADGAPQVLLVVFDSQVPEIFRDKFDAVGQAFAWAWLLQPAQPARSSHSPDSASPGRAPHFPASAHLSLSWEAAHDNGPKDTDAAIPAPRLQDSTSDSLDILKFFLRHDRQLLRHADGRLWTWRRHD